MEAKRQSDNLHVFTVTMTEEELRSLIFAEWYAIGQNGGDSVEMPLVWKMLTDMRAEGGI